MTRSSGWSSAPAVAVSVISLVYGFLAKRNRPTFARMLLVALCIVVVMARSSLLLVVLTAARVVVMSLVL